MPRDGIDQIIDEWARIRREVVGIKHPLTAREYLGPLRCTLAKRADLHAGSRSEGQMEQNWPPFPYEGNKNAELVNRLYWKASPCLKEIFDWHWTLLIPRDKRLRADLMGISRRVYWDRVARVKVYVEGGLAGCESVRTLSPSRSGINVISITATRRR